MLILFVSNKLNINFNNHEISNVLISYISPCMILAAYMLLDFFSNKTISLSFYFQKFVLFLSSASLAVFVIHTNHCVLEKFMKGRMEFLVNYNSFIFFFGIVLAVCGIYMICSLIKGLRLFLFRIFKINKFKEKIEDCISFIFKNIMDVISREK